MKCFQTLGLWAGGPGVGWTHRNRFRLDQWANHRDRFSPLKLQPLLLVFPFEVYNNATTLPPNRPIISPRENQTGGCWKVSPCCSCSSQSHPWPLFVFIAAPDPFLHLTHCYKQIIASAFPSISQIVRRWNWSSVFNLGLYSDAGTGFLNSDRMLMPTLYLVLDSWATSYSGNRGFLYRNNITAGLCVSTSRARMIDGGGLWMMPLMTSKT